MRSTLLNCVLSLVVFTAVSSIASAAPFTNRGPGGMGTLDGSSSLEVWLKNDPATMFSDLAGTTAAVNGGKIRRWNDLSGNGRNALADIALAAREPDFFTGVTNGLPAVTFSGGAINTGSRMTINSTSSPTNPYPMTGDETAFFALDFTSGFGCCRGILSGNDAPNRAYAGGDTGMFQGVGNGFTYAEAYRVNGTVTGTTGAGTFFAITGYDNNTPASNVTLRLGSGHGGNADYAGRIAEVILFSDDKNIAQRIIGENYISSRHNIGVGGADKSLSAGDRYNGDLTTKGNFDFDVFGVGRASNASLQLNGGMAGFGIEIADPGSEAWALAGHATGTNGVTTADLGNNFGNSAQRWERSWYVDVTGPVGTANLAFDWNDSLNTAPFNAGFNALYARAANSGVFSLVAIGVVDIANQRVDFSGITLSDEFYYTLGSLPIPEPSTFTLLGLGAIGLAVRHRRRRAS